MPDFDNTPAAPVVSPGESWANCRLALTSGVTVPTTLKNGDTLDGVVLATGNRFLCVGTRADAGIYTVGAGASTRSSDADAPTDFVFRRTVHVTAGSGYNTVAWIHLTEGAVELGVTALTFSALTAQPVASVAATAFDNNPPEPLEI